MNLAIVSVPMLSKPIYKFQYLDNVSWIHLSGNINAIPILQNNLDKINWYILSSNPNAIPILQNNLDKVDWVYLSKNPNAIPILEKNIDKVNWIQLSKNPNAIHILEKNLDKVDWCTLSNNPNARLLLSKLDYEEMKLNTKDFSRELVEYVFYPERLMRICERNDLELGDLLDLL
jgi:hypothetical protein